MKKMNIYCNIFLRYLFLILIALPNLFVFYFIFTPLTVYPVAFLLDIFFEVNLVQNIIFVGFLPVDFVPIEIIDACVAGAAYYLLLILNFAIPNVKLKKRFKMITLAFASLLLLNILRIFALSLIFIFNSSLFYILHEVFWYSLSTLFVVGIWFYEVKCFKIKEIPFVSDLKILYEKSILKKKVKKIKKRK